MVAAHFVIEILMQHIILFHILNVERRREMRKSILLIGVSGVGFLVLDIYRLLAQDGFILLDSDWIFIITFSIIINVFVARNYTLIPVLIVIHLFNILNNVVVAGTAFVLLGLDASNLGTNSLYSLVGGILGLSFLFAVSKATSIVKLRIDLHALNFGEKIFISIFAGLFGIFIAEFIRMGNAQRDTAVGQLINFAAFLGGITMTYGVLFFIAKDKKLREAEVDAKNLENITIQQIQDIVNLQVKSLETGNFMHDIKIQLATLASKIKRAELEEAILLIEELGGDIVKIEKLTGIETGLVIVNTTLNLVVQKCPNVKIEWDGRIPKNVKISNKDMVSLFYNLLSNAVDAANQSESVKIVQVSVVSDEKRLVIVVRNSYNGELIIENESFITTKSDKESHGFGVRIVKNIVRKYQGKEKISYNEKEFIFKMIFDNGIYRPRETR